MRGRIFESKNMAHAGVDSATRACEPSASWVRAREALARGCGRRVLKAVLGAHVRIRMWRQGPRGRVFSGSGAHVWGRADYLPCLLYNMMSMDLVPVQTLVKVDSYRSVPQLERRKAESASHVFPSLRRLWRSGCRSSEYTSIARYHMVWEMAASSSAGLEWSLITHFIPF